MQPHGGDMFTNPSSDDGEEKHINLCNKERIQNRSSQSHMMLFIFSCKMVFICWPAHLTFHLSPV